MTKTQSIEELKNQVLLENRSALRIARVPPKIRDQFTEIAESEYCGDYGWFLSVLLNNYLTDAKTELLFQRMLAIEEKVFGNKPEEKTLKSISGKIIKLQPKTEIEKEE